MTEIGDPLIATSRLNPSQGLMWHNANEVALEILCNRTGVEALQQFVEAARRLAKAEYAALGVANREGNGLLEFLTAGMTTEEINKIGERPTGNGILALLYDRTEPLRIDVIPDQPAAAGFPPNHPLMSNFLGVPIRRGDNCLGILYLTNKIGDGNFTTDDETIVQTLGTCCGVAIHNLQVLTRQRALVSGLMLALEEERRSVAYDLHDGLTQYVMAAHAHLEGFQKAHKKGNVEKADRDLAHGLKYLKEAVIESRRMVNGLRPLALDDLGLVGAVEQLVVEKKERAEWDDLSFIHNIASRRVDRNLETTAYRVIQEALTNARKHAETKRAEVVVLIIRDELSNTEELQVSVRDWGKGFVISNKEHEYEHFGLHGMIERIQLMGGRHTFYSEPGEGTFIRATFPILAVAQQSNEEQPNG